MYYIVAGQHLAEPDAGRWWAPHGPDKAADSLYDEGEIVYAIDVQGTVVGAIECYGPDEPDYRRAGIDIFLGTAYQGQGLGGDAIRSLARYLFEERGHHRLIIDPALANERAIRVYERIGFRRVGVLRAYERGADDTWRDGPLLDLLEGELTTDPA